MNNINTTEIKLERIDENFHKIIVNGSGEELLKTGKVIISSERRKGGYAAVGMSLVFKTEQERKDSLRKVIPKLKNCVFLSQNMDSFVVDDVDVTVKYNSELISIHSKFLGVFDRQKFEEAWVAHVVVFGDAVQS